LQKENSISAGKVRILQLVHRFAVVEYSINRNLHHGVRPNAFASLYLSVSKIGKKLRVNFHEMFWTWWVEVEGLGQNNRTDFGAAFSLCVYAIL